MSSVALAQPAGNSSNAPPTQLQDRDDRSDNAPPPSAQARDDERNRDMFCRRDAAARTGYVTPGQAANRAQTEGSVGGTVAGAAAGAAIGAASGRGGAGPGALIGAGVGHAGGTAIGADNARHAASDMSPKIMPRPIMPAWTRAAMALRRSKTRMAMVRRRLRPYYDGYPYPYPYPYYGYGLIMDLPSPSDSTGGHGYRGYGGRGFGRPWWRPPSLSPALSKPDGGFEFRTAGL